MATKHETIVKELDYKVGKLIKQYILSLEQNKRLEARNAELEVQVQALQQEKQELDNKLKTARTANAIASGEESEEARLRINRLVREVEKCIALLNN